LKLSGRIIAFILVFAIALLSSIASVAAPYPKGKDKESDKEHEAQKIDSGSFGIFMSGHRVGTETFSIYQSNTGSVIKSEFKTENDPNQAVQDSVLQLTASGEIRHYEWKEVSPGKAESVVVPNDQFLNQKWSSGPQDKPHEQPYLLSPATSILDDYFFIHREVLVWKFMAAICTKLANGQMQCLTKQRTQFGTLDPRQHSSAPMSAEYLGREKINFKGSPQEFSKVELKTDVGSWQLWLDDHDQFKVMRIIIEGDNTEVIRD
jgi:hypothetical protein